MATGLMTVEWPGVIQCSCGIRESVYHLGLLKFQGSGLD
jgi:hypothetical protein